MIDFSIRYRLLREKVIILVLDNVGRNAHDACLEVLVDQPASQIRVFLSKFHTGLPISPTHVDEDYRILSAVLDQLVDPQHTKCRFLQFV